ncbi:MAG: 6-carboxytetrahydropterin synthase [Candidatus Thorarchaeota archaeon]
MHSIHVNDQRMSFSAAHFVVSEHSYEPLHGHNYSLDVYITGEIDSFGMVVDFRDVKKQVINLCKSLDHKVLLPGNSEIVQVTEKEQSIEVIAGGKRYLFPIEDCVILPFIATTAELLAEHIAIQLEFLEGCRVKVCVSENVGSRGCFETKMKQ